MTKKQKKPTVYPVDGFVAKADLVGFPAYLYELEDQDVEFTRFYMYSPSDQDWGYEEYNHDIVSVCPTSGQKEGEGAWHLLSKRGVHIVMTDFDTEHQIPDAGTGPGKFGYVSQIRPIGNHLYVCGMCRQVYRFDGKNWHHIDQQIIAPVDDIETSLESIDGTSEEDIYAVGWKGEIYHYDGQAWTKCDSPTNVNLTRVKCVSPDLVYICGREGILLVGSKNSWKLYRDAETEPDFWGVECFNDLVYLASMKGLRVFDGQDFLDVQTGLKKKIDGYRLHANDGVMWSFGQQHLAFFDGAKWTYVKNPEA